MGLLELLSGVADKAVGKGQRGAFARGLLGMELPEGASTAERDTYNNAVALTNTPTPLALAAAPAALIKSGKNAASGALTALERAQKELDAAKAAGFTSSDGSVWRFRDGLSPVHGEMSRVDNPRQTTSTSGSWGAPIDPAVLARNMGATKQDASGLIDYVQGVRDLRIERNIARDVDSFVNSAPAVQPPEWVSALTHSAPNRAAGAEWWSRALKDKSRPAVDAFAREVGQTPGGLLYGPGTDSRSAAEIASAFSSSSGRPIDVEWAGDTLRFKTPGGHLDIMNATSDPVIRSTQAGSKGKAGGDGKLLYQSAYQWLANNDKVAAPDVGLSDINQLRKLGNELSAQVRNGKPSAVMNTDRLSGVQDIPALWAAEAAESVKRVPSVGKLKFDGQSFKVGDSAVTDAQIAAAIAKSDPTFSLGVGPMTAKRAALYKWLQNASPSEAGAAAKLIAGGGIAGISGAVFADQSK